MSDILTDADLAEIEKQGADLELFADKIFATIRLDHIAFGVCRFGR